MWTAILDRVLNRMIDHGALRVIWPDGQSTDYGNSGADRIRLHLGDAGLVRRLCLSPELALGEGYMDGRLWIEEDDIDGLLTLLVRNRKPESFPLWVRAVERLRRDLRGWLLRNNALISRRNVAHHYDLSDAFYRCFLDDDMQYSCAYFQHPGASLEEAQIAKKRHIANKLRLTPDCHVLDIGCGWGGMALTLAREHGVRVTGVTLSENQHATALARARDAGLSDRVSFELRDYRTLTGPFDRIVSVGMFEHVGPAHYGAYFAQVDRLLAPGGVALIHTIGYGTPPKAQSPWIQKYIFPGGHIPALSEIAAPIEQTSLWQTDLEVWRLHYAETLRHWRARFEDRIDEVRKINDDPRFIRMWRFYLSACEVTFRETRQGVFQIQLAKDAGTVPITRDYLYQPPVETIEHAAE